VTTRSDQGAGEVARRVRAAGNGAGAGFSVELALGTIARHHQRQEKLWDLRRQVHTVLITAPLMVLAAGAGSINQPDLLGPHDGYEWDVKRLVAASFTAGTVNAYRNYQADANLIATWSTPGTWSFNKQLWLNGSDAILFTATGIVGQVTVSGEAVQVPSLLVPDYLS
jgi:hypothetical protein